MIFFVIIILAAVSVGLSLWSLRGVRKMHEVDNAKVTLSKSKILFQRDDEPQNNNSGETQVF